VSRGEGELLTVPKPRAVSLLSVYLAVKPVGKPDAGNRLVRFDERGWETERCRMAQATAPILDSTSSDIGPDNEPLDDALIIALACDDLTIALGLLRSCLASVKP
jgi:hypothetical protein